MTTEQRPQCLLDPSEYTESMVHLGRVQLHVVQAGPKDGPPVLLLHGFRCNRGLWHRWVRCLNEQGVPHRSLSLSPPFASIDDYASQIDAAPSRRIDTW